MNKILLAVCTCKRPVMLAQCLESLISLQVPAGWQLHILVIENDKQPQSEALVASFNNKTTQQLSYCLEDRAGIPYARNRAISEAINLKCNWIAFIDDDEYAQSDWLLNLTQATIDYKADVVLGRVIYKYPDKDRWALLLEKNQQKKNRYDGKDIHSAATNNVIFSANIFSESGMALRFDTNLQYTGGSDTDYFNRARINGAKLVYSEKAVVYEEVPIERCSLGWLCQREARICCAAIYIDAKNIGVGATRKKHIKRCLRNILQAFGYAIKTLLYALTLNGKTRTSLLKSCLKLASAYGRVLGFWGINMAPYVTIDGG